MRPVWLLGSVKPLIAVTRQVSRSIINCELTHLERTPIDIQRARAQHAEYEAALKQLGLAVLSLPEEPNLGRFGFCRRSCASAG